MGEGLKVEGGRWKVEGPLAAGLPMNDDAPATVWEHDTPDLVDHALGRLSRKFGVSVEPGSIRASISERAVLDCLLDGVPVVVKIDTMSYRGKRERDVPAGRPYSRPARTANRPLGARSSQPARHRVRAWSRAAESPLPRGLGIGRASAGEPARPAHPGRVKSDCFPTRPSAC